MFEFDTIPANQLTTRRVKRWREIQSRDSRCFRRFLSPGFARGPASARDNVRGLIIYADRCDFRSFPHETCRAAHRVDRILTDARLVLGSKH